MWSVKCEVWGLECEGSSEKWEVWSVDCEVWSVECEVWSLECEECSVKCGVWRLCFVSRWKKGRLSREGHGRDRLSPNYRSFIFGKLPPPACPGLCYIRVNTYIYTYIHLGTVNYNNSLTWIKAIYIYTMMCVWIFIWMVISTCTLHGGSNFRMWKPWPGRQGLQQKIQSFPQLGIEECI